MLAALLALAAQAAAPMPLLPLGAPECRYDHAAMLLLSENAFDQDFNGGWRALSNRGCESTAADLIRDYRTAHPSLPAVLSFWHEGQLRADVGQSARAIALFEGARKTEEEDHGFGWNLYVDGSIAFLRRDKAGLQSARDRLAALPRPADLGTMQGPDGKPRTVRWPFNLNVLDGFIRCFDDDYRAACACATPMLTVKAR